MSRFEIYHSINRWLPLTAHWILDQMQLFNTEDQTVLADTKLDAPTSSARVLIKPNNKLLRRFKTNFRKNALKPIDHTYKILWSHFGNRAWRDLPVPCDLRIARFYGYDLHRLPKNEPIWRERYLELFEKTDLVICEGPFMKEQLRSLGGQDEKIKVLPIGVQRRPLLNYRASTEKPSVLIAGAFKEKKGIIPALKACQKYLKLHPGKLTIHLVGDEINATPNDRQYAKHVRMEMAHKNLQDSLVFHSTLTRQELIALAEKCQIGLFPSQWADDGDCEGGYPITILDVMSTGLPVISTRHCDIPFVVNESNGILCDEGQVDQLVEALETLLKPEVLIEKSKGAFHTVETHFNWEVLKSDYRLSILGN